MSGELLEYVGENAVPATKRFVVAEHFVVNTDKTAAVKFFLNEMFKEEFLGKIEEPQGETVITARKLKKKSSLDRPITDALGGEAKAETTLAQIFSLIETQKNGERGFLLVNGYANFCYVRNKNGVLCAVEFIWFRGSWRVAAYSIYGLREQLDCSLILSF